MLPQRKSLALEKYFVKIDEWLKKKPTSPENNQPLVIEGDEGSGKKMLIAKWAEYNNRNRNSNYKNTVITHFASTGGSNSNYFYAIYNILIRLRNHFNINQKVELLEEKLRKYFYYWLDLCSRKIKENIVYDGDVVIIIEGIDSFADPESGGESPLKFWLPKSIPDRIRIIMTATPDSKSKPYLASRGCEILTMASDIKSIRSWMAREDFKCPTIIDEAYFHQLKTVVERKMDLESETIRYFLLKSLFAILTPSPLSSIPADIRADKEAFAKVHRYIDFEAVGDIGSVEELLQYGIGLYADRLVRKEQLLDILSCVCLTHKGLTEEEIMKFANCNREDLRRVLTVFKTFMMSFESSFSEAHSMTTRITSLYWISTQDALRNVVAEITYPVDDESDKRALMHARIASIFDKSSNNIRKLEEETNHLYLAKSDEQFFLLKQRISTIENFLILFNPTTKFDLFRFWRELEHHGYDPVTEYNKGVELFDTQYNPEPDKLFIIILQVCRFLKEFSDFETDITPVFRHPAIKGKIGVVQKKPKKDQNEDEVHINERALMKGSSAANLGGNQPQHGHAMESSKSSTKLPTIQMITKDNRGQVSTHRQEDKSVISSVERKNGSTIMLNGTAKKRKKLDPLGLKDPFYNEGNELSDIEDKLDGDEGNFNGKFNYLEVIGLLKELKQFNLTVDPSSGSGAEGGKGSTLTVKKHQFDQILEDWEDVNLEVPAGREEFRNYFLKILAERYSYKNRNKAVEPTLVQAEIKDELSALFSAAHGKSTGVGSKISDQKALASQIDPVFSKDEDKKGYKAMMDDIDLEIKPEKVPSYYYYKR